MPDGNDDVALGVEFLGMIMAPNDDNDIDDCYFYSRHRHPQRCHHDS